METSESKHYYLRHLTNILPAPSMLVGGLPIKCRPTLHWSILGPEVKNLMRTMEISPEGVTTYVPSIEGVSKKYAVVERFDVLAPHIIGGEYMDIFTLGEHKPSEHAYLFIPSDEQDTIDRSQYGCNIIIYNNAKYTVSEAINNLVNEYNLVKIIFATPALSTDQSWEFLENRTRFITDAINHYCPSLMQKQPIEIEEMDRKLKEGSSFSTCINFSFTIEEILYDVVFIPVNINNVIHLVLWFPENSPERLKMFRYFWYSRNNEVKFDAFLYTNNGTTTLSGLFLQHGVPLDLCNIGHAKSGLIDLERDILKVNLHFKEKFGIYKALNDPISEILAKIVGELKTEYSSSLTQKLQVIPVIFADKLYQFFSQTHENALIERHNFVVESINKSQIDSSSHL